MRVRKTRDVFVIQGNYGHGWEDVTEEDTRPLGREQLKCYRDNEPGTPHRMIVRRENFEQMGWLLCSCDKCGRQHYVEPHGVTAECECSETATEHTPVESTQGAE